MLRACFLSFLISLLQGYYACTTVKAVSSIYAEKPKPVEFRNNNKIVKFIPMHHVGKPEFFSRVSETVRMLKNEGYKVYYESARMDEIQDSVQKDLYERKFRKMLGIHTDTAGYARFFEGNILFRNMIDQPKYDELGVTQSDIKVDISKNKLVDVYEEKFGKIQLDSGDYRIPLNAFYPLSMRLPRENTQSVIIGERDRHLAGFIHHSADNRIIVLYGAIHRKGVFNELVNLDKNWKKK